MTLSHTYTHTKEILTCSGKLVSNIRVCIPPPFSPHCVAFWYEMVYVKFNLIYTLHPRRAWHALQDP